ncbi:DNA primase DnaG [Vulcanisaeta distributa]|uniref:DNA primase DnaG n=1 Tax=Vulcanisaeta distributa (strain DSM 14429 / JCM 11212 / NBRC 100878 / IC-017) TaxID=572478 RepID=E1QPN0_VULDI|nr:DNA primase DnaG [Vulcanisaeta distributa]ADN50326.1 TOPRIM domain protein [Vulcanisaeta distributa DSM 14429]
MGALTIVAKYLIVANVEVQGTVEKYDIIGALFSQTEGLLGNELDLRELQMNGRIGRIEVETEYKGDKTVGKVYIPSNLDRYETALVAAMIETVDKVGPYNAKVQVVEIKDLREEKRKKIFDRARELLKLVEHEALPDTKELITKFMESIRETEVIEYGPEKLPAGPEVDTADTIIIVEGRADVLNLVKHGFKNVIGLGGSSGGVPKTVVELSKKKTTIAFVDGDRGGEMLLKELLKYADIDYIARAPPGKEVEQLTAKEITKALRNKVPAEEYLASLEKRERKMIEEARQQAQQEIPQAQAIEVPIQEQPQQAEKVQVLPQPQPIQPTPPAMQAQVTPQQTTQPQQLSQPSPEIPQLPPNVIDEMKKLGGTLEAIIYDDHWTEIKRIPVRDLVDTLQQLPNAYAVIFDGVCTQRLVDVASSKGVKLLIMSRVGNITKVPTDMLIMTIDEYLSKAGAGTGAK